jgi:hypothetical protein
MRRGTWWPGSRWNREYRRCRRISYVFWLTRLHVGKQRLSIHAKARGDVQRYASVDRDDEWVSEDEAQQARGESGLLEISLLM